MTVRARPRTGIGVRLLVPLATGTILNPVNTTLISVALIPIGQAFGVGPDRTAWLVSGLYLGSALGQPVVGLLVDRFGARRTLVGGSLLTLAAGLVALLPVSIGWLVGLRLVIGIGTSAAFPAAMAVLRRHSGAETSGGALAVLAVCSQAVAAVGPALGGLLVSAFGWQAVFVVNAPLAVVVLALTLLWVPRDRSATTPDTPVDLAGIGLFSVALLAVMLLLMFPAPRNLWLLAPAALAAGLLVPVTRRARAPFLHLGPSIVVGPLLRTYLRQALTFLVLYAVLFGYVQWLDTSRGLSEAGTGLLLLPLSGTAVLFSAIPFRLSTWVRLTGAAAVLTGAVVALAFVDGRTPLVVLLAMNVLFGVSQGLVSLASQTVLYRQAHPDAIGIASGLFRTAQFLGAIGAATVIGACFRDGATTPALHALAVVLAVASALLVALTALDRALRASPEWQ
ncbi:MFS transporter [Amycolatopsis jiangsuensis]|uniref:MFS family permease n=1 Tax=Amycolatopsis jiangsuensis TaxID=1181879 RepID=A0A840IZC8_9PSEU|nr:MFS transporter [Amycolatopsis jiangsuensis]MBB4688211.1 MFS family permease [Amycolatopsis jiangsuensis]